MLPENAIGHGEMPQSNQTIDLASIACATILDGSETPPDGPDWPIQQFLDAIPEAQRELPIFWIGGCGGQEAVRMARLRPRGTRTIVIEALPANYVRWLLPQAPLIEPVCAVIGARREVRTLYVKQLNGIHSLYNRGEGYPGFAAQTIVTPLDEVAASLGICRVAGLIVDVEGATWDVLQGAPQLLATCPVLHVETETVPFFFGQVLEEQVDTWLLDHGWEMVERVRSLIGQNETLWRNPQVSEPLP